MTKEEQELREKIAETRCEQELGLRYGEWQTLLENERQEYLDEADSIIDVIKPACYLKAERELPQCSILNYESPVGRSYLLAQKDMLTPDSEGRVWASVYQW